MTYRMEQKTIHDETIALPWPFAWLLIKEVHQEHLQVRQTGKYKGSNRQDMAEISATKQNCTKLSKCETEPSVTEDQFSTKSKQVQVQKVINFGHGFFVGIEPGTWRE